MKPDYQRQMDFYSPSNSHKVLVVGAGSIGSYITFGLARMGVKDITVVDYDKVENHNLPNQFFSESGLPMQEGEIYKVIALQNSMQMFMPDTMSKCNLRIIPKDLKDVWNDLKTSTYSAIFMAVDDMNIRKWLWTELERMPSSFCKCLIDPRVGGLYANIFSISMSNSHSREVYKTQLWNNEEVPPLPCTGKSVIDVTFCVAGEAIGRFRQFTKGQLSAIWTFHAYNMGTSQLMEHNVLNTKEVKDSGFVVNAGNEPTAGGQNV